MRKLPRFVKYIILVCLIQLAILVIYFPMTTPDENLTSHSIAQIGIERLLQEQQAHSHNHQYHYHHQHQHQHPLVAPPKLHPVTNFTATLLLAFEKLKQDDSPRLYPRICKRRANTVPIQKDQVTVTVHASTSKFQRLLFSIQQWGQGPVSACVYLRTEQDILELMEFCHSPAHQNILQWTDIHVVLEKTTTQQKEYPHNILRQAALSLIPTNYFLTLDVDFVTPPNAAQQLHHLIQTDQNLVQHLQSQHLMVLPAFDGKLKVQDDKDLFQQKNSIMILPQTKSEALQFVQDEKITPFHVDIFPMGHGPTNFTKWLHGNDVDSPSSSFYFIDYAQKFEPYVLGYKGDDDNLLPEYWRGFRGYGFNKWTWLFEAYLDGYQFGVLRDFWVVHVDHPRKQGAEPNWAAYGKYQKVMRFKYGWDESESKKFFADRKDFQMLEYDGPPGIPRLVSWSSGNGAILGRIFQSANHKDGELVGTSVVAEGEVIAENRTVTCRSGQQFYLSDAPLKSYDDDDDDNPSSSSSP